MHDLVVRNGTVIEGTGAAPVQVDVAIDDGLITALEPKAGPAHREVNAEGLLVTPGWVDIHTHYDGQATWDPAIGFLARRQKDLAISEEAKKIAWKAQQRLHKRYQAMAACGKNKNQIVAALGRELLGFIWAIAVETERQQRAAAA